MPDQSPRKPFALVVLLDGEGDLRRARAVRCVVRYVACAADHDLVGVGCDRRDQHHFIDEIHRIDARELGIAQRLLVREEPRVHGFALEVAEGFDDAIAIVGAYGANRHASAVAKCVLRNVVARADHGSLVPATRRPRWRQSTYGNTMSARITSTTVSPWLPIRARMLIGRSKRPA